MPYSKTIWIEKQTRLGPTNMNKIEQGIADAAATADTAKATADAAYAGGTVIYDARGDLIVGTGDNAAGRLPIGTDGQVLGVSGGTPAWIAPPAAGSSIDYENVYNPATAYQAGDVVNYGGVEYLAVNPSTGSTPPSGKASVPLDQKGAANGVATLDATTKVPVAQIPTGIPYASVAAEPKASISLSAIASVTSGTFTVPSTMTVVGFDTASLYTSAGKFTVPAGAAGVYLLVAYAQWNVFTGGSQRLVTLFYNGGEWARNTAYAWGVDVNQQIVQIANLLVGDTVDCRAYQDSGSTQQLTGNTRFSIARLA